MSYIIIDIIIFSFSYSTVKTQAPTASNSKEKPLTMSKSYSTLTNGRTLLLNAKNCELCNKMFPKTGK